MLAGGAGSRLGGGKATLPLGGRPLIAYPIAAARAGGLEPVVVAKADTELPPLDCRLIVEPDGPRHPLAGIVAALEQMADPLVVVPCDAPFLTGELLARLACERSAPALAVEAAGRLHPLVGRYTPATLPALRAALERGGSARDAFAAAGGVPLAGCELAGLGDPERLLDNVNTAEDLATAKRKLRAPY